MYIQNKLLALFDETLKTKLKSKPERVELETYNIFNENKIEYVLCSPFGIMGSISILPDGQLDFFLVKESNNDLLYSKVFLISETNLEDQLDLIIDIFIDMESAQKDKES